MEQTHANNKYTQLTTYSDAVAAYLTLSTLKEPNLVPEASASQDSHPTPGTFRLPGIKPHFLFSTIHDSKR